MTLDLTKFVILCLATGAVIQDLASRKVSNKSVGFGLVLLLLVVSLSNGMSALLAGLGGGLTCLGVGFVLWRFGVLGAGDVKVLAVLALSLPWARSLEFFFYSLAWGSVLGALALLLDKTFLSESKILNFHPIMTIRSHKVKNHKIPFTVGIWFGVLTVWLLDSKGVYFL